MEDEGKGEGVGDWIVPIVAELRKNTLLRDWGIRSPSVFLGDFAFKLIILQNLSYWETRRQKDNMLTHSDINARSQVFAVFGYNSS